MIVVAVGTGTQESDSLQILELVKPNALERPVKDAVPVTNFSSSQYDAVVEWRDSGNAVLAAGAKFAADTQYKAIVTITPKAGYSFGNVATLGGDINIGYAWSGSFTAAGTGGQGVASQVAGSGGTWVVTTNLFATTGS
jgi:hypothetical protein